MKRKSTITPQLRAALNAFVFDSANRERILTGLKTDYNAFLHEMEDQFRTSYGNCRRYLIRAGYDVPTMRPPKPPEFLLEMESAPEGSAGRPEIEETVIEKIRQRREAGRTKYGTTMERTDLSRLDWLHHAQQQAMDFVIYLEKLIREEETR